MNCIGRDLEAPSRADDLHRPALHLQDYLAPDDITDFGRLRVQSPCGEVFRRPAGTRTPPCPSRDSFRSHRLFPAPASPSPGVPHRRPSQIASQSNRQKSRGQRDVISQLFLQLKIELTTSVVLQAIQNPAIRHPPVCTNSWMKTSSREENIAPLRVVHKRA